MACLDDAYDAALAAIVGKFDTGGECEGEGGTIPPERVTDDCHTDLADAMWSWAVDTIADPDVDTSACSAEVLDYFAGAEKCIPKIYPYAEELADCVTCVTPSTDCSNCAVDCDGAATITMVVTGFTGMSCEGANGTYVMSYYATCQWNGNGTGEGCNGWADLFCDALGWSLNVITPSFTASCNPCALVCSGDHPTGSGVLLGSGPCTGQTGSFTLS